MLAAPCPPRFPLIALCLFAASWSAFSQPVISEFLANNSATLDDQDGESSDWIEILNPGPGPVDLGGYSLTDDLTQPRQWIFPSPITLNEGFTLIVFASGKDRTIAGQELHTNFSLDSEGEYLALAAPDGSLLQDFFPAFPAQKRDISYGTASDGSVAFLDPPTPGAPNRAPLGGFVADTVFSHKRGFYRAPFSLAITSATPGASIRYTTNGTKPSPTFGTLYTGPLTISATTVLRAIAFKPGMVPTNVDAESYLFTADLIRDPEMNQSIVNSPSYRNEIEASLRALPVVTLSFSNNDLFGPFGIHRNPLDSGPLSEREIHFEYFDPADPSDSTHEPCGVRIHGGNSREHPKKNFRLYFRSDYGKSSLDHALFPDSPVDSFKHLLLRGGGHDAWTFRADWDQATLIRNEFLHRVQLAMGNLSPHGRFVNLFMNGIYWGVYELQELPHEDFNADHNGGQPEDWDVIKHGEEVEAGNSAAWDDLLDRARSGINSGTDYAALQEYLDIDNFADAMIHRIWSSDEDWLSPEFRSGVEISTFTEDKNWYVARRSRNGTSKFFFYSWDAEMSMGIPFSASRSYQNDFTRIDNDHSPGLLYDVLRRYPEFQLRFADRLHKHLFNGGALTILNLQSLWDPLVSEVRSPMVAESARWGLESWTGFRSSPYTRDDEWLPAVGWVRSQFIANRSAVVLEQFRNIGLYPDVPAPVPAPPPGDFPNSVALRMSTPAVGATIYYTTDGSDPYLPANTSVIPFVTANHPVQVIVPNSAINAAIGTTWREIPDPSNITSWINGLNGVGFEGSPFGVPNFTSLIRTPLDNMRNVSPGAYLRFKFNIPDQATIDSITQLNLRVRYDDGFVAFLNGTPIESQNANVTNWNSAATGSHSDALAINFVSFDQTNQRGLLVPGQNVLAIHGLNRTASNNDFLIQAVLEGASGSTQSSLSPSALTFTGTVSLSQTTQVKARTLDAGGDWSALTDVLYRIGTPASAENLTVTEINYHPADPLTAAELNVSTSENDFEFVELLNLGGTPIDLSFCRFEAGLDFEFPTGVSLLSGARTLLVSNRQAFLARYGSSVEPAIGGEFANHTNLSNKGERLTLLDATGQVIFNFRFEDAAPWPFEPDGGGPSLVLIDPPNTLASELGDASRWRSSFLQHGAPDLDDQMSFELWARMTYGPLDGTDPATGGPLMTPSGPGTPNNLILYAQGQDLSNGDPAELSIIEIAAVNDSEYLAITFQLRDNLADVSPIPEVSADLITWTPDTTLADQIQNADGTRTITVRDLVPRTSDRSRFIRLRFEK